VVIWGFWAQDPLTSGAIYLKDSMEGFLQKKSDNFGFWNKRYCHYNAENNVLKWAIKFDKKGYAKWKDSITVTSTIPIPDRPGCRAQRFDVTGKHNGRKITVQLSADTAEEHDKWLQALQEVVPIEDISEHPRHQKFEKQLSGQSPRVPSPRKTAPPKLQLPMKKDSSDEWVEIDQSGAEVKGSVSLVEEEQEETKEAEEELTIKQSSEDREAQEREEQLRVENKARQKAETEVKRQKKAEEERRRREEQEKQEDQERAAAIDGGSDEGGSSNVGGRESFGTPTPGYLDRQMEVQAREEADEARAAARAAELEAQLEEADQENCLLELEHELGVLAGCSSGFAASGDNDGASNGQHEEDNEDGGKDEDDDFFSADEDDDEGFHSTEELDLEAHPRELEREVNTGASDGSDGNVIGDGADIDGGARDEGADGEGAEGADGKRKSEGAAAVEQLELIIGEAGVVKHATLVQRVARGMVARRRVSKIRQTKDDDGRYACDEDGDRDDGWGDQDRHGHGESEKTSGGERADDTKVTEQQIVGKNDQGVVMIAKLLARLQVLQAKNDLLIPTPQNLTEPSTAPARKQWTAKKYVPKKRRMTERQHRPPLTRRIPEASKEELSTRIIRQLVVTTARPNKSQATLARQQRQLASLVHEVQNSSGSSSSSSSSSSIRTDQEALQRRVIQALLEMAKWQKAHPDAGEKQQQQEEQEEQLDGKAGKVAALLARLQELQAKNDLLKGSANVGRPAEELSTRIIRQLVVTTARPNKSQATLARQQRQLASLVHEVQNSSGSSSSSSSSSIKTDQEALQRRVIQALLDAAQNAFYRPDHFTTHFVPERSSDRAVTVMQNAARRYLGAHRTNQINDALREVACVALQAAFRRFDTVQRLKREAKAGGQQSTGGQQGRPQLVAAAASPARGKVAVSASNFDSPSGENGGETPQSLTEIALSPTLLPNKGLTNEKAVGLGLAEPRTRQPSDGSDGWEMVIDGNGPSGGSGKGMFKGGGGAPLSLQQETPDEKPQQPLTVAMALETPRDDADAEADGDGDSHIEDFFSGLADMVVAQSPRTGR
jgi:hypothetical protein